MKIYEEKEATDFENQTWCCKEFWDILHKAEAEEAFNQFMEMYTADMEEGMSLTAFNDLIRFESDWIFEQIGVDPENPTGEEKDDDDDKDTEGEEDEEE